jgi:hypothetical protein
VTNSSLVFFPKKTRKLQIKIKRSCFSERIQPTKHYRDDGQGGWEEQLEAESPQNGWTAWVPLTPKNPTLHKHG